MPLAATLEGERERTEGARETRRERGGLDPFDGLETRQEIRDLDERFESLETRMT
jgi:hypothetical protein